MKKVLLLSLSLALGFSAFAQQRVAKDDIRQARASKNKVVVGKEDASISAEAFAPMTDRPVVLNRYEGMDYARTVSTTYDLQSNQYVANRMYQMPDGSVAVTATMSHQNNQTASDRGTGYNFFNGETWSVEYDDLEDMARIESFKTGWPSIARWGETGEILLCHGGNHMNCYTREVAGQGEWVYMGTLPDAPADYPYNEYATWPRVVTSGDNHNIINAVACIQNTNESLVHTVLYRSEDAVNWEVSYGPLQEMGYEEGYFSADDYCMAANGHTVAILYSGSVLNSTWLFKSTDDGLTWEPRRVWQDPYEAQDSVAYTEELYRPMNGAVVIDNNGVCHVALNTFLMMIDEEAAAEGSYSYYYGRTVDGILYWNDTEEGPIQAKDGNPHNAARLWWPIPDDTAYVQMEPDSTRWIGYIPVYRDEDETVIQWENDKFYHSSTDYYQRFYGASGHPALSCDPQGNLACAFSSPCMLQEDPTAPYYLRHIYVSYRNVDNGYWEQLVDDISDPEEVFELSSADNLFTISVLNTVNDGEFWFGFQSDDQVGLYWGSNSSQSAASDNGIYVMKVNADPEMVNIPENNAINPMTTTRVYPNPTTDVLNIEVNASQAAEMSIKVYNIMGQNVMNETVNINTGINCPSINTSELTSGIYFVTVKANGFENTMKFIVK
jgi:hypothetical protein